MLYISISLSHTLSRPRNIMNPYEPSSYNPSYNNFSYSADTYRPSRSKDPRLQPRTRRSSRSRSRSPERHHNSSNSGNSSQRLSSGLTYTSRSRELSWSRADIIREEQSRAPPAPSPSQQSSIPSPRPATPPRGINFQMIIINMK